jgi:hypothetical protein
VEKTQSRTITAPQKAQCRLLRMKPGLRKIGTARLVTNISDILLHQFSVRSKLIG